MRSLLSFLVIALIVCVPSKTDASAMVIIDFPVCEPTFPGKWTKSTAADTTINVSDGCDFAYGADAQTFHADATATSVAKNNSVGANAVAVASGAGGYPTSPATASASASASGQGQILITGGGAFDIGYLITQRVQVSDCVYAHAVVQASAFVSGFIGTPLFGSWNGCESGNSPPLATIVLNAIEGDIVSFSYFISANAGAVGWAAEGIPVHSARGEANAGNTMYFFVVPKSPGASYVSLDGVDYSLPTTDVPEPGTMTMLGLGLAGVAARLTRGRHSAK